VEDRFEDGRALGDRLVWIAAGIGVHAIAVDKLVDTVLTEEGDGVGNARRQLLVKRLGSGKADIGQPASDDGGGLVELRMVADLFHDGRDPDVLQVACGDLPCLDVVRIVQILQAQYAPAVLRGKVGVVADRIELVADLESRQFDAGLFKGRQLRGELLPETVRIAIDERRRRPAATSIPLVCFWVPPKAG
jgi:hypothetical protein